MKETEQGIRIRPGQVWRIPLDVSGGRCFTVHSWRDNAGWLVTTDDDNHQSPQGSNLGDDYPWNNSEHYWTLVKEAGPDAFEVYARLRAEDP